MVKTLKIHAIKLDMYEKIKSTMCNNTLVTDFNINKDTNEVTLTFECDEDYSSFAKVLPGVGVVLLLNYANYFSKYKNNPKKTAILSNAILEDDYLFNVLYLELISYFEQQSELKETVFFKFNMKGFDAELDIILERERFLASSQTANQELISILESKDINFKDYEEMFVDFDEEDCFCLKTKSGVKISPENINDILGIELQFECEADDLLTIVAFCCLVVSFLKVKKLYIVKD